MIVSPLQEAGGGTTGNAAYRPRPLSMRHPDAKHITKLARFAKKLGQTFS
jgi:hypothetical protein